jgi:restriction system protein
MFSVSVPQWLLAVLLLVGAAILLLRQRRPVRHDDVATDSAPSALAQLPWPEFHAVVGEYFRRREFAVTDSGRGQSAGAADLVVTKRDEYYLVQCRRWRSLSVDVDSVRELCLSMATRHAAGGFVVTAGTFTTAARAFAEGREVELIDGEQLWAAVARQPRRRAPARA